MDKIHSYIIDRSEHNNLELFHIDLKGKTDNELMLLEGFDDLRGDRFIWWAENGDGTYQLKVFNDIRHCVEHQ